MSTFEAIEPPQDSKAAFDRLIPNGGIRFSGADFRSMCGPLVYLFLLDGNPLYVGMSEGGLSRPASAHHHKRKAREKCNEVLIWPTRSRKDALELESILIRDLQPKYNCRLVTPYFVPRAEILGIRPKGMLKYREAALSQRDKQKKPESVSRQKAQDVVVLRSHDNATQRKRIA